MKKLCIGFRVLYWTIVIVSSFCVGFFGGSYEILFAGVFLLYFIINGIWYYLFWKGMQELSAALFQERNAEKYIAELNSLMDGMRSKRAKAVRELNIAVAYTLEDDYEKAMEHYAACEWKRLDKLNQTI